MNFFFSLEVDAKDHNSITLSFEQNKIVIQSDPLRIDIVSGGEPVISVNSRALLKYEHYRAQPWVFRVLFLSKQIELTPNCLGLFIVCSFSTFLPALLPKHVW